MRKFKKAFTLVELLVVIAIVAILATAAILGFTSYIKKAKLSNDITLVKHINTALQLEELNEVPSNMYEAKEMILSKGYAVDISAPKLSSEGYYIGYDVKQNTAVLLKGLNGVDLIEAPENYVMQHEYDIFVPVDHFMDDCVFSQYLNVNATEVSVTTDKGFDVGDCSTLKTFNYVNTTDNKDIIVRTNSLYTQCSINDESNEGKITHYGVAGYLNIIKCPLASYHEFGHIPAGEINTGRIVNENGSVTFTNKKEEIETVDAGVKFLYVNSTNEPTLDNPTTDDTVFDEIIVAAADGASLPEFGRGNVNIADVGTLVVKTEVISEDSKLAEDYIWLFKSGVKEQIVVTSSTPTQLDNAIAVENTNTHVFELKSGLSMLYEDLSVSDANEKAAEEIANSAKRNNLGQLVDANNVVIEVNTVSDVDDIVLEDRIDEQVIKAAQGYVAMNSISKKYYMDAELAFNEASQNDAAVIVLADITVSTLIPDDVEFELGDNKITLIQNNYEGQLGWLYGTYYICTNSSKWSSTLLSTSGWYCANDDVSYYYYYKGNWYTISGYNMYSSYKDDYPECFKELDPTVIATYSEFTGNSTTLKLFSGGYGTEAEPYLISSAQELRNISELAYRGKKGNSHFASDEIFFKLTKDLSITDLTTNYDRHGEDRDIVIYTWYPAMPDYSINLNGHSILNIDRPIFGYIDNLYMHDGTLVFVKSPSNQPGVINTIFGDRSGTIEFENLSLVGEVGTELGPHYGPLASYANGLTGNSIAIKATNVNSSVKIINGSASAYSGGLFGFVQGTQVTLSITDCSFSGVVQSANAGGFVNGCSSPKSVTFEDNTITGSVLGTSYASAYGTSAVSMDTSNAIIGVASPSALININNLNIGDEIVINHTNSSIAYYMVNISTSIHGEADGIGGICRYIIKTVNVDNPSTAQSINTGMYKNKIIQVNEIDNTKENILYGLTNNERMWLDGDIYYYYGGSNIGHRAVITNPGAVYISIYGYDSNNNLITYQNASYTHELVGD